MQTNRGDRPALREYATDIPQVAADVISACDAAGETRRQQTKDKKDSRIKRCTSKYGLNVVFALYVRPATCKKRLAATAKGLPLPDDCMRCGPGSGQHRCSKRLQRSQGGAKGFLATGCSRNDPLAPAPDRRGRGAYSNLRAHLDVDSVGEDPADFDFVTSTSSIIGWNPAQPNISIAIAIGIPVSLPTPTRGDADPATPPAETDEGEATFLATDRQCDIDMMIRAGRR